MIYFALLAPSNNSLNGFAFTVPNHKSGHQINLIPQTFKGKIVASPVSNQLSVVRPVQNMRIVAHSTANSLTQQPILTKTIVPTQISISNSNSAHQQSIIMSSPKFAISTKTNISN